MWPPSPRGVFRCAHIVLSNNLHEDMMNSYHGAGNRDPMHIIFGPRKVVQQIESYYKWKSLRFSGAGYTHKRELLLFIRQSKICCLEEISPAKVNEYIASINSMALRAIAFRAIQGFLQYCRLMGYTDVKFTSLTTASTISQMNEIHPRLRLDKVQRAKELRAYLIEGKPMSYRAIKTKMESEDKCVYDVHAIYRWVNYQLPKLSTV